jgi:myo-inositol 2-dehydrogenase / D-chiro-inositol 1-dehydrogenase
MINFAIFGAGFIGKVHAKNLYHHPRVKLRYVYDVNQAAAAVFHDQYGAQVVSSPEAIWGASDVDAVLIASSTNTHADLLSAAIDAGKPAFCEKPIDLDMARVKAVAQKAKGINLPIAIGFSRRFDADYSQLQARFRRGEIGKLEMLHLTTRGPQPPPISYVKVSGGQFRDQTIHFFDLASWIAGELATEVYGAGTCLVDPAIGEAGDVDTSMVMLKLPSGALCHIDSSRRAAYGYDERIEAFGADGMLEAGRKQVSDVLKYGKGFVEGAGMHPGWFERIETSFETIIDAFVRSLEGDDVVLPTLWDGLRAQQIADAVVQSVKTNRPVQVEYWTPS